MENNSSEVCGSKQVLNKLGFPYHAFIQPKQSCLFKRCRTLENVTSGSLNTPFTALRSFIIPKVCAAEKEETNTTTTDVSDVDEIEQMKYSQNLEALAKAYIQQETGWERVKALYEKDHRGKNNVELSYMQVTLVQVFILTFFCKYFPAAKFARKEFIRENKATVFRTRLEAIRLLQDHTFIKAGGVAAGFSTKVTLLSASFLALSSVITHYRNKTSVWEYSLAAGITGGLARMNMGVMGLVVGSVLGGVLGSAVGLLGYVALSTYGITTEERHLEATMERLEVFKHIEGESKFKDRVNQLLAGDPTLSIPSS